MSTLIAFDEVENRLRDFESSILSEHYDTNPIVRGIVRNLIQIEWEGTPDILSDAIVIQPDDLHSYKMTMERLGYLCDERAIYTLEDIDRRELPCFIRYGEVDAILMDFEDGLCVIYDYTNDVVITKDLQGFEIEICNVSFFSKLFREPPPQSQDRSNWVKYCFYKYGDEIKSLIWLSFFVNLLGAIPPFFIMSVYNFALSSESVSTLLWLASGSVIVALLELTYKKKRTDIITSSGKELSVFISYHVLSKILWLPYAMSSKAGVSAQMARLRDIDQIRSMATSSHTLSYFDLPFVVIFLVAILAIAGVVAMTVVVGIIVMMIFCLYARFLYQKVTTQSSRANALVSYQWNDLLANLKSIQGLPILQVIQSRFKSAHAQSVQDAETVSLTNAQIQRTGQAFIQAIGATSIVAAVFLTMEGMSDAGAMIAIIILVWKVLSPIMGIYNAIIKFQSFGNSTKQINNLMVIEDNKHRIEKSAPINRIAGEITLKDISQRYPGALSGLTQINAVITPGDKVAITGPSGCGKTTLLNIMAGIWEQYQGGVFCDGYNIRQFNNFCYRNAIKYVPLDMHFFEGTVADNFRLYNGQMLARDMEEAIDFFNLRPWLGEAGAQAQLTNEFLVNLPAGVRQMLRLCIGLGNCPQNYVLIDEPLLGCANDYVSKFVTLFNGPYAKKTIIFTTGDKQMVTLANNCLLLDDNGGQKYFGYPDKVLQIF